MTVEKVDCALCATLTEGIFCCLEQSELARLSLEKAAVEYYPDRTLFNEGEPAYALFCIRRGLVKLTRRTVDGQEVVTRVLGAGSMLGHQAVLTNQPYDVSAHVVERASICSIPRETLFALVRNVPELALRLLAKLALENRTADDRLLRQQQPASQRAASFLLQLADESSGGSQATLRFHRKDMAQILGVTPETVSRILRSFANRGLVALSHREVTILDAQGLRRCTRHPATS